MALQWKVINSMTIRRHLAMKLKMGARSEEMSDAAVISEPAEGALRRRLRHNKTMASINKRNLKIHPHTHTESPFHPVSR